jgi:hypothetical protein
VEANNHGVVNNQPVTVVAVSTLEEAQVATAVNNLMAAATHTEVNNSLLMAANKATTKDTEWQLLCKDVIKDRQVISRTRVPA